MLASISRCSSQVCYTSCRWPIQFVDHKYATLLRLYCTRNTVLFCFGLFFLLCFCICFWLLLCVWGGGNDANFNNNWSSTSNNKSINNNLFWTIYIERERETHTILKQLYWYCSCPHIFNTCAYVWLYICISGCWYLVHMHFIRKLWPPWEVNYLKKVW